MAAAAPAVSMTQRDGIAIIEVNYPPVNALSYPVRLGLKENYERAVASGAKAIVLVGGGRTFPAGADVTEFKTGAAMKEPVVTDVVAMLDASSVPIVAAIHGTALGGGLEIALACHYRIAAASAKLGLPEVNLGLLPGAGGTQRLPRLIGLEPALDVLLTGRHLSTTEALKVGLVDKVVPDGDMSAAGLAFAATIIGKPTRRVSQMRVDASNLDASLARWRDRMNKERRGFLAPMNILETVKAAATLPFEDGMNEERRLFVELFTSPQTRAQQQFFFAIREAVKIPDLDPSLAKHVASVGVVGAGLMGSGIAACFLDAGITVVLLETSREFLDRGVASVRALYSDKVKKKKMSEKELADRMARLKPTLSYTNLGNVDVVVEAVFENMAVKHDVFRALERATRRDALLFTNTSSLDVDTIASVVADRSRVLGLHFFSPAHTMKLVEVVRGSASSPAAVATAMKLCAAMKKQAVLVGNCPGFVANRSYGRYTTEALFLAEEGAEPSRIDKVLYDFGFPMGPFAVMDLVGIDTLWRIRQARGRPPAGERDSVVFDLMHAAGRHGQKSGSGFYRYDERRQPKPDPAVNPILEQAARAGGVTRRTDITDDEIIERCVYAAVHEGFRILDEGIALRPSDIDVIWVFGYGFPVHRGGPMHYADATGLDDVLAAVEKYHARHPTVSHWKPAPALRAAAAAGNLTKYWKTRQAKPRL